MRLVFDSKRLTLRTLRPSDAPDLYANVKDKEIVTWTMNIPHPYPKDGALKFIRKARYDMRKRKAYVFGIVLKENSKVIGVIDIRAVDWNNRNGEIGYWLGKDYWGKGLMTEAVSVILKFGFEELKLHRVYAKVFADHLGSKRVLEKSGFKLEGTMRKEHYRYGRWHDMLIYGVLRGEWTNYLKKHRR